MRCELEKIDKLIDEAVKDGEGTLGWALGDKELVEKAINSGGLELWAEEWVKGASANVYCGIESKIKERIKLVIHRELRQFAIDKMRGRG